MVETWEKNHLLPMSLKAIVSELDAVTMTSDNLCTMFPMVLYLVNTS